MFSDPQFWVAVSFVLFIAVIFNPVRKTLASNLDAQIKEIEDTIKNAETLKNQAQKTFTELLNKEADVAEEIEKLKKDADEKIKTLKHNFHKRLEEQIEKKRELSQNKIDQIIRDANTSLKDYITTSTSNASSYILKKNLTEKNKQDIMNASIDQLKEIIKN